MTEKEIIEGNKLIAEFMGWKIDGFWWIQPNGTKYNTQPDFTRYNYDWRALMPVMEKIVRLLPKGEEKNNYMQSSISIEMHMNSGYPYNVITYCKIGDLTEGDSRFYISKGEGADGNDGSLIKSVWQAFVAFIEFHNQNP